MERGQPQAPSPPLLAFSALATPSAASPGIPGFEGPLGVGLWVVAPRLYNGRVACIILTHFTDRLLHYPAFSAFSLSPNKATEMPLKDNEENATPEVSWPSEKRPLGRGQPAVCSVHAPVRPGCVPVPKPSDRSRRLCKRETRASPSVR